MTASSDATRELTVNTIVLRAMQLAGVRPAEQGASGAQWDANSAMARDFLEMIIDALQSQGVFARSVDLDDIDITASTQATAVGSSTLDCIGNAMFAFDADSVQTQVAQVDRERWQRITDKTATGRPSLYWFDRQATAKVYLWPIPDAAGTLTIQRHRLLGDNDDGSATLDLQRYWVAYVTWELARYMAQAKSLDGNTLMMLEAKAQTLLSKAKAYAMQRTPSYLHLRHRSGHQRRR